ncbi:MAG: hypothetical protein Ct9H300mP28_23300 [Pseudomonadota bacterium]|nr:MAG: hypothetical protein Ct9H300mP28_23300 [Pseudomonadota bacterium]
MHSVEINEVNSLSAQEKKTVTDQTSSIKYPEENTQQKTPLQNRKAAKHTANPGNGLSGFFQQQNETLQVHRQYLEQQSEYSRTVYKLMQQQIELASQGTSIPPEVDRQMQLFHAHQSETLRVHEQYLNQQSEQTQSALSIAGHQLGDSSPLSVQTSSSATLLQQVQPPVPIEPVKETPAPVVVQTPVVEPTAAESVSSAVPDTEIMTKTAVPEPISPSSTASGDSAGSVMQIMMAVVSEKTGYPQEMLELGMDIESDLGIDSIKRVEILGAVQDRAPELDEIPADELVEMRTLGQIVEYLQNSLNKNQATEIESITAHDEDPQTRSSQETVSAPLMTSHLF